MMSIEQLFPDARTALSPLGLGMVLVESSSDLANIAFTRNLRDGSLADEHFMWLHSEHEGKLLLPSGS